MLCLKLYSFFSFTGVPGWVIDSMGFGEYLYQHVRRHYYQPLRSLKLNIAYTALLHGSLTYGARVIHQRHPKPYCQSPIQGSRRLEPGLRRHLYVTEDKERHTPQTPSLCRAGHIHHPHKNPYYRSGEPYLQRYPYTTQAKEQHTHGSSTCGAPVIYTMLTKTHTADHPSRETYAIHTPP